MIETWNMPRSARLYLVGSMLASGFVATLFLLHQGNFAAATAIFATALAALVGTGKLASP